jgi:hypothetical protein
MLSIATKPAPVVTRPAQAKPAAPAQAAAAPATASPAIAASPAIPASPMSTTTNDEHRNAPRRPASAVPSITGIRISPHGVEASLINISVSGVLTECGERLKPGSAVTVVFEGTFVPRTIEGRVARNSVSAMGKDGRLRYHVGISFTTPIDLGPDETAPVAPAKPEHGGPVLVPPAVRNRW